MYTRILAPTEENIEVAAELIRASQPVAVPTETVYGLAANALDSDAVDKIFIAKGRPGDNPLIVHLSSVDDIDKYAQEVPGSARKLLDAFSPGPLTVVLKKKDIVPDNVTAGLGSVALRIPSHPVFRKFIAACKVPIAAPSANISGKPSPTDAQTVFEDMEGKIPLILDGGECSVGIESTVVSFLGDLPKILRPGIITKEQIESVIGELDSAEKLLEHRAPEAPGMKYKHYAPEALLTLVIGKRGAYSGMHNPEIFDAVLCYSDEEKPTSEIKYIVIGDEEKPETVCRSIFSSLRLLDKIGASRAVVRIPDTDGIYSGLYNRLLKASRHDVIDLR